MAGSTYQRVPRGKRQPAERPAEILPAPAPRVKAPSRAKRAVPASAWTKKPALFRGRG
ncbi:MAG: hypothetical protein LBK77_04315 [Spirochaetaceae bacterium]|nr:hypothetical protein [Spirochaetaceae bacterium]